TLTRFGSGVVATLVESFVMKSLTTAGGQEVHSLRVDGDLGSLAVSDGRTIRLFSERPELLPGGVLAQHDLLVPPAATFSVARAPAPAARHVQSRAPPLPRMHRHRPGADHERPLPAPPTRRGPGRLPVDGERATDRAGRLTCCHRRPLPLMQRSWPPLVQRIR